MKLSALGAKDLNVHIMHRQHSRLVIALSHYYKDRAGDLVPELDFTIAMYSTTQTTEVLRYEDYFGYRRVYSEDGMSVSPSTEKGLIRSWSNGLTLYQYEVINNHREKMNNKIQVDTKESNANIKIKKIDAGEDLWSRLTDANQTPEQSRERVKMYYDYFKHMTTLSSGSLILISVMAEKFTIAHKFTPLLTYCLISFLLSILGSLLAMSQLPRHAGGTKMSKKTNISFFIGGIVSVGLFGTALFLLEIHLLTFG